MISSTAPTLDELTPQQHRDDYLLFDRLFFVAIVLCSVFPGPIVSLPSDPRLEAPGVRNHFVAFSKPQYALSVALQALVRSLFHISYRSQNGRLRKDNSRSIRRQVKLLDLLIILQKIKKNLSRCQILPIQFQYTPPCLLSQGSHSLFLFSLIYIVDSCDQKKFFSFGSSIFSFLIKESPLRHLTEHLVAVCKKPSPRVNCSVHCHHLLL